MRHDAIISIVVPVYNTDSYLRPCLDSIKCQSYSNIEVLLVNDGSTDESSKICREYASVDGRFRLIEQESRGQSAARNAGLDLCTGDYVTFIDSDDVVSPCLVEILHHLITNDLADCAMINSSRFSQVLPKERISARNTLNISTGRVVLEATLYQRCRKDGSVCGKIFTRESIADMRFKDGMLYEDLDFIARYLMRNPKVVSRDDILYFYRRNPESTLGKFRMQRLDVLKVTNEIMLMTAEDELLHKAAMDRRLSAAFNMYALLCRNGMATSAEADMCMRIIHELRWSSLLNPKVRMKNKAGIMASFAGRCALAALARCTRL